MKDFEKSLAVHHLFFMSDELKIKSTEILSKGESLVEFCALLNLHIENNNKREETDRQLIKIERLRYYHWNTEKKYIEFKIPKKSGGERTIFAPDNFMLKIQRIIVQILDLYFEHSAESHGFINGRSIVTNAEMHTNKEFVLNVDIENYFPSIKIFQIRKALMQEPFNLNSKMASFITRFATLKGGLPQGAASSPLISNIVSNNLDKKLKEFAIKHKQTFTRYADDISFSGYRRIYDQEFFKELNKIFRQERFKIKKSKTRIQARNNRQVVTGITVNEKLNVNRKYIRELRVMIHHYKTGRSADNAFSVISGKLEFLKMVKGKDRVYKNLMKKFKT